MMLTEKQEIALALVLLKSFYQQQITTLEKGSQGTGVVQRNFESANHVTELARKLGVHEEFFQVMFDTPVLTVKFTREEEWDKKSWLCEMLSGLTEKRTRRPGSGRPKKNPFVTNPPPRSKG